MLSFALALVGCTSDTPVSTTPPRPGAISGRVVFDDGSPAAGAEVATTNASAVTDAEGRFDLLDLPANAQTPLRVHPAGGTLGSKFVAVDEGETTHLTFRVMRLQRAQLGDAAAGGTIVTESGLELVFPAHVLGNEAGEYISGPVDIDYALLNTLDTMAYAPGNLLAWHNDAETRQLVSNGMAEVTLTQAGAPVDVLGSVMISFPTLGIPDMHLGRGCGTPFKLYGFDAETGLWLQDDFSTFEEVHFSAWVDHFSYWNCDATVVYDGCANAELTLNGEPLANQEVGVWLSDMSRQVVTSDSTGAVQIRVPNGRFVSVLAMFDAGSSTEGADLDPYWSLGRAHAKAGSCVDLGRLEANGTDADGDGERAFPFGKDCNDLVPGRTDADPCDITPTMDSGQEWPDPRDACDTGA